MISVALADLSKPELIALVKLLVANGKTLIPSNNAPYLSLWDKGYCFFVSSQGGFVIEDGGRTIARAAGIWR